MGVGTGHALALGEIVVERRTCRGMQRQQAAFLEFRVPDEQAVVYLQPADHSVA
jgi:hypothetical protein